MGFNFRHRTPIVRKTEKWRKKPIAKVGRLSFFGPLNRYVPLVKGPKKAVSGGKMVDLGGRKRKTPHLRDWRPTFASGLLGLFSTFAG